MLFAVMGFFKPDVDTSPAELQADLNEHLAQPALRIALAGYLRNRAGQRTGLMGLIEAQSFDRAEAYLHASPYFQAGLYGQVEVLEFDGEVGRLP
jgi:uncharacterized protein YciI